MDSAVTLSSIEHFRVLQLIVLSFDEPAVRYRLSTKQSKPPETAPRFECDAHRPKTTFSHELTFPKNSL